MKTIGPNLFAAGLLLMLVAASYQTMTSEQVVEIKPIVETPQDAALSKLVRDRIHAEKKVDLTSVKVDSSCGTFYLSRTVQSLDAREHAIKSASEVSGVQSVVNHLNVKMTVARRSNRERRNLSSLNASRHSVWNGDLSSRPPTQTFQPGDRSTRVPTGSSTKVSAKRPSLGRFAVPPVAPAASAVCVAPLTSSTCMPK